jgi:Domain of unknown function (DUF1905)
MGEMMAAKPGSVSFEATVTATGNNTGIVVPDEVIEQLAAGRRPPVLISLNGYEYRTTVGVMNGQPMISVSAAVRTATGLKGGDPVHVTLTVADSPREVTIPEDFAAALAADEQAGAFFLIGGRRWVRRTRQRTGVVPGSPRRRGGSAA